MTSKMNLKEATIEELEEQCQEVQGTPFGHNIIALICQETEERFGEDEAVRLFETYQN
tara:strand:- start:2232 stop:2405 length:174 start_codon:yes stop_codon:yes gene_type:complete